MMLLGRSPTLRAALALLPVFALGAGFLVAADDLTRRLLAGGLFLYGGGALAWAGLDRAFRFRDHTVEAPDPDRFVAEVDPSAAGTIEIEGVVQGVGGEPLTGPLTGDACLWYDVRMERLGKGVGGEWGWNTVCRETKVLPFAIEDDSGVLRVEVAEDAVLAPLRRFESVNPTHARVCAWRLSAGGPEDLAEQAGLARQGIEVRFSENRLREGDLVLLRGEVVRGPDGAAVLHARAADLPPPIEESRDGDRALAFLVPRARDRRALQGVALSLVGAAFLVWGAFTLVQSLLAGDVGAVLASLGR